MCAEPGRFRASTQCSHEIFDAQKVIDRRDKGEHPPATADTFEAGLPEEADRLEPAEDLFDELSFVLAHRVTGDRAKRKEQDANDPKCHSWLAGAGLGGGERFWRRRLFWFLLPKDAPESKTVQVAGGNAEVVCDLGKGGGQLLVAEQFPGRAFAVLHVFTPGVK